MKEKKISCYNIKKEIADSIKTIAAELSEQTEEIVYESTVVERFLKEGIKKHEGKKK